VFVCALVLVLMRFLLQFSTRTKATTCFAHSLRLVCSISHA
jgi:hypothetical protein